MYVPHSVTYVFLPTSSLHFVLLPQFSEWMQTVIVQQQISNNGISRSQEDADSSVNQTISEILSFCFIHSVLMLDEAHERTLYTDIAIGLLKKVIFFF